MRYRELLFEAQDYEGMFRPIINIMDAQQTGDSWKLGPTVAAHINQVRTALRKNDRIVWFLRLYRIGLLTNLMNMLTSPVHQNKSKAEQIAKLQTFYQQQYASVVGGSTDHDDAYVYQQLLSQIASNPKYLLDKLEHFLSLPIPEIQDYVFRYDNPRDLLKTFAAHEKKWQDSRQGMIAQAHAEESAQMILNFSNGFAWWLLDKAYCPHEADAMGHCGNEPRANSTDRILSLRKTVKRGKQTFYAPYATFILGDDGALGEMKGRFNHSPKRAFERGDSPSDFNDEILALLKLPMIKSVVGGGYMPRENFKVADLTPEQINELGELKPNMLPLSVQYKRFGITPDLIKSIVHQFDEAGKTLTYDETNQGFVWDWDRNMAEFIENNVETERRRRDPVAAWVLQQLENGSDFSNDYEVSDSDKEELLDALEGANPQLYADLVEHVTQLWKEDYPDEDEDDVTLTEMIGQVADDIDSILYSSVNDGRQRGAENEMSSAFENWLEPLKQRGGFWIVLPEWDTRYYDGKVNLLIDVESTIRMIDNGEADEDAIDEGTPKFDDMEQPYYGWSGYDQDAALEHLLEQLPGELPEKPKAKPKRKRTA